MSSCLAARASPRWASSEAKCAPRRRPNASRAAANRVHSASSVLRSMPRIVFHSSTIAFSRSPAAFHDVDSAAICSASAASASLRAICAARAAAFSARDSAAAESAVLDHRPGPRGQAVEVADGGGRRDRLGEDLRLVLDLGRVAGVRLQPRLEQGHLGGEVVVAASVVGQPGGRLAGLPGPDGALAVGGADVDGAVLVDPAPLGGVAGRGGGDLDGGAPGAAVPAECAAAGGGGHRPGGGGRLGGAGSAAPRARRAPRRRLVGASARWSSASGRLGRRRLGCAASGARLGRHGLGGGAASAVGGRLLGLATARLQRRRARGRPRGVRRPARPRASAAASRARLGGGRRRLGGRGLRRRPPAPGSPPPATSGLASVVLRNRRRGLLRPGTGVVRARHVRQCPTSHPGHCCRDRRSRGPPAPAPARSSPSPSAPSPPLLLPAVEGRPAAETPTLRRACAEAVARLLAVRPEVVVVVGGGRGRRATRFGAGRRAATCAASASTSSVPFAGPRPAGRPARAARAHRSAPGCSTRPGSRAPASASGPDDLGRAGRACPARSGVLAMGDGSARRTLKAPGYLDPAAAPFDAAVAAALADGDAGALAALDPAEGERLLAAGVPDLAGRRRGAGRPRRSPPGCTSTPRRSASATSCADWTGRVSAPPPGRRRRRADRHRQDRAGRRARAAARRRGGQRRLDAALPRHGHRHRQARRSPSAAACRTTCSTSGTSARRPRSPSTGCGRARRSTNEVHAVPGPPRLTP